MAKTTVVHVNAGGGYDEYIGRASPRKGLMQSLYRNHFVVGHDGDAAECVRLYEHWVRTSADTRAVLIRAHVHELQGKRLACWCKKKGDEPCHGDVLAAMADATPSEAPGSAAQ